ncbi:putative olfactory receptor 13C6 [Aplochiton taeniatus]
MNKSVFFPLTLVTYPLIITVNLTLIITIIQEKSLHEPMYIFICNLSINSLYGSAGFYPMFLNVLLSDIYVISYAACFTQAFVIYSSVLCEITILSVMAFDRYVAICRPLHYHTLMSPLNHSCVPIVMFDTLYGWYDNDSVPVNARNAMAVQFLVIPPLFNPIIYGLNIKKIQV